MEHTLMDLNINVEEHFKQNIDGTTNTITENKKSKIDTFMETYDISSYGLPLEEVYNLARNFLKEKDGKAVHLSYDDRNLLNILPKQIYYGRYRAEADKNIGFLDLVGKERLQLWKSLGEMSKEDAMKKYILLLVRNCPLFHTTMEAHKRNLEEEKRKKQEEEEEIIQKMSQQRERKLKEDEFKFQEENKKKREEMQKKQIQEALNQQTYPHFKAYAEQQHPNNLAAQQELIKQLQEQHFEQYMNQVYQQQLLHQQQQAEQLRAMRAAQKAQRKQQLQQQQQLDQATADISNLSLANTTITTDDGGGGGGSSIVNNLSIDSTNLQHTSINFDQTASTNGGLDNESRNLLLNQNNQDSNDDDDDEEEELPPISAATMITKKEIQEFKDMVRKDNDAIIKIGSGETVTVRVPTHEDGRFLYWEFATDYYDIGFGLYFEWTISPSNNVTVQVSDSSDEEDLEEGGAAANGNGGGDDGGEGGTASVASNKSAADVEKGKANSNKPPCDEIIPIFRRDSHTELYAGSHIYPGRGVYLLKFDNSYSLWRSKTLYYRVYYSK